MIPKETFYGFNRNNKTHVDKLKRVLSLEGPKRWRAAAELYLYLNPKSYSLNEKGELVVAMDARTEAKIIQEEAAKLREGLKQVRNEMGKSKDENSGRRYALRMPATMLQFIQLIDPTLLEGTPDERKSTWRRLQREFKEYAVLTVI